MIKRLITLLITFAAPSFVFAASSGALDFTPPPTDVSLILLSNMFGVVDGVLHGSGSQIMGQMFGVFNSAVLFLAGIVAAYTLFSSVLNTAHDGEVLGRNMSSIWIPMRTVAGVALLIPKASGYCAIQIFVMWIVVMGIGAADKVWETVLSYLQNGGTIISMPAGKASQTQIVNNLVIPIFKSEVCTIGMQMAVQALNPAGSPAVPSFTSTFNNPSTTNNGAYPDTQNSFECDKATPSNCIINFPGLLWSASGSAFMYQSTFNSFCGSVDAYQNMTSLSAYSSNSGNIQTSRKIAVQQVIIDVYPYAQQLVNFLFANPQAAPITSFLTTGALVTAARDYAGIMASVINVPTAPTSFVAKAKEQGWILSGSYYFNLVKFNTTTGMFSSSAQFKPPTAIGVTGLSSQTPNGVNISSLATMLTNTSTYQAFAAYLSNEEALAAGGGNTASTGGGTATGFTAQLPIGKPGGIFATITADPSTPGAKALSTALNIFTLGFWDVIKGFSELFNSQNYNLNPIVALATIGNGLINFVSSIWLIGLVTVLLLGLFTSIMSCTNPVPFAIQMAITWLMPMLTVMMVLFFTTGVMMAYYIPMIPFIIFLFASLGWFIGVIESMVAAPLVALGIAHPEGNPILGKAEPALMLITNIFLRPTLMVFGLVVGIIMSYVIVWLLNFGFMTASDIVFATTTGFGWIFAWAGIIVIYTGIVMALMNKVFTLIHLVPDNVMRWLTGGMQASLGSIEVGQMMGDVKGTTEGAARAAGQGMSEGTKAMGGEASEMLKGGPGGPGGPGPDLQMGPGGPGPGPGPGEAAQAAVAAGTGAAGAGTKAPDSTNVLEDGK